MKPIEVELLEQIPVHDWRHRQPNPPPPVRGKRKHRLTRGRDRVVVERDPRTVDSVVIHQTACDFGPNDNEQRELERAFGVACHAVAFKRGAVVLPNPLRWVVLHANALSDRSLGLEVEGLYAGLEDDPSTVPDEAKQTTWKGRPDVVTELAVAAARRALRELVERGRAEGMPIRYVIAHRQSSGTRRSDPGQTAWRRVVLEYAVPVLGLETMPARAWRSRSSGPGRPIPKAWDPTAGVGRY